MISAREYKHDVMSAASAFYSCVPLVATRMSDVRKSNDACKIEKNLEFDDPDLLC
jgi:hypothetical protein